MHNYLYYELGVQSSSDVKFTCEYSKS